MMIRRPNASLPRDNYVIAVGRLADATFTLMFNERQNLWNKRKRLLSHPRRVLFINVLKKLRYSVLRAGHSTTTESWHTYDGNPRQVHSSNQASHTHTAVPSRGACVPCDPTKYYAARMCTNHARPTEDLIKYPSYLLVLLFHQSARSGRGTKETRRGPEKQALHQPINSQKGVREQNPLTAFFFLSVKRIPCDQ